MKVENFIDGDQKTLHHGDLGRYCLLLTVRKMYFNHCPLGSLLNHVVVSHV